MAAPETFDGFTPRGKDPQGEVIGGSRVIFDHGNQPLFDLRVDRSNIVRKPLMIDLLVRGSSNLFESIIYIMNIADTTKV